MKTRVIIKNIKVSCILGVKEKERQSPQEISITLQLVIDAEKASKTDNIDDTVNYKDVYGNVIALVESSKFHLLEALGAAIADMCLTYAGVKKVSVTIAKFNKLQKTDYVAIDLEKDNE